RHGRRAHDVPRLAVPTDLRKKLHEAVDDTADIHPERPVPVVVSGVDHRPDKPDGGVVDENVHLAEHAHGFVGCGGHRRAVRHVELEPVNGGTGPREKSHRVVKVILAKVGNHDFHAGDGECSCHAQTHAAAAPGNE